MGVALKIPNLYEPYETGFRLIDKLALWRLGPTFDIKKFECTLSFNTAQGRIPQDSSE